MLMRRNPRSSSALMRTSSRRTAASSSETRGAMVSRSPLRLLEDLFDHVVGKSPLIVHSVLLDL